jgi:regulator of protease activity HflC (stomatin/prohibitin superfamily)
MKNLLLALNVVMILTSCSGATPGAGEEAVLIQKPWFFGHGGIDESPVKTGFTLVAWTTTAVTVSMQPQQFNVHFEDIMSSDGVPLDFDAGIRLQILDSVKLIKQFGENWYKANVEQEFANRVRQAVRKHGMNETAISTVAIDAIDTEISTEMTNYLKQASLPIALIQVTVGKANPPDSIKHQRINTAAEQQRILTEKQRKLAEDNRQEAERSRAAADNAYREKMQLSPSQFLQLETIKMQRHACEKGNCTFLIGTNSPTPVIPIK